MCSFGTRNHYSASRISLCALSAFALYTLALSPAFAGTLCNFYQQLIVNDIARGAATLAVVALALGAMFGRVTWGMAILVAVGISGLFGAATLAGMAGTGCQTSGGGSPTP